MTTVTEIAEFHNIATAIHAQYTSMAKDELFVVGTHEDSDRLYAHYLASFPEGSNPIYRKRTEHDCSCCRNFIRQMGRVVRIKNGKLSTIWEASALEYPYDVVAKAMRKFVEALPVTGIFRTKEHNYGNVHTLQRLEDGTVKRWDHFHAKIGAKHRTDNPGEAIGLFNGTVQVFRRGLEELLPSALQQVVELIESNAIYRGEEHLAKVKAFQKTQDEYLKLDANARALFVWEHATNPANRFRNEVIGTLVTDLSDGVSLERAVAAFELKVAPTNYKRTTALITPRMIQDAMKTINELGLEPALARRLASLEDVSVNNVLWVDRTVSGRMRDGVEAILMGGVKQAPTGVAMDITITEFMANVLPVASSVELHLRNQHQRNFMTLTAPVHANPEQLFKWNNNFAWSYDGNVTDTIKEKVKRAGGNVDAKLRFSLAWFNYDDLDIHVELPDGTHVYFANPSGHYRYQRRILDVDMNAGGGTTREPVENLSFVDVEDGQYKVWVNQYQRRETTDVGFTIEVAHAGGTSQFSYQKSVNGSVAVGTFMLRNGQIVKAEINPALSGTGIQVDKWGLKTETTHKVLSVMYSPNYWDDNAVGNKHWFFILEGCRPDEPVRGIYNEYLASGLEKHRKVFEVLGDKTKCPVTENSLSGLGFSSTRGDTVTVSVSNGKGTRLYNINF